MPTSRAGTSGNGTLTFATAVRHPQCRADVTAALYRSTRPARLTTQDTHSALSVRNIRAGAQVSLHKSRVLTRCRPGADPVVNEQLPGRSPPALTNRPALIDDHGRLRQEDVPVDGAISDVERVEPVRPTADSQGAAEPVVQLPADPLPGKQPNCRRPARPRRQPEERLHTSEHTEPITFVPQTDTDLAKAFPARTRLEVVTLGHLDEVSRPRRHLRQREADRRRVPAGSGLPTPRLLRPGRLDPLHRDVHRTCPFTESLRSTFV